MSKLIGYVWFNGRSNIGIVMGYDEITKEPKAWISSTIGHDLDVDLAYIMGWGTKFPIAEACSLIMKFGTIVEHKIWEELYSPKKSPEDARTQHYGC